MNKKKLQGWENIKAILACHVAEFFFENGKINRGFKRHLKALSKGRYR